MNAASFIAAVVLLCTIPFEPDALRDRCDCIEVNRVYDLDGHPVLAQVVFWDWCDGKGCHRVCDWRLWKSEEMNPRYDYARREWRITWQDGERSREVTAPTFRERWTQYDVETVDRDKHPIPHRRLLSKPGEPEP